MSETHDPYAALAELEQAEAHYRLTFQVAPSADHLDVGRAWDRMKRAGDAARAALAQRAEPVAYRYKTKHGVESEGSVWHLISHPGQRDALSASYGAIAHPLYAAPSPAPQAQQVSGAADPVGSPAGEQTGPVSAAPTYTPQDAQPEPVSAADELQRPTTFHTEQSLADIAVAQEASLHKHAARSAAQPELLSDEQIRDLVKECGLDWHRGFAPLFDGDETNRYAVLARAIERAVTEQLRGAIMSDRPKLPEPKRFAMNYDNGMLYESERGPLVLYLDHNAVLATQAEAMQGQHNAELVAWRLRYENETHALRAERDAAIPAMREYARQNPVWNDGRVGAAEPVPQDPNGAHAWLDRNDAARAQGGTPT